MRAARLTALVLGLFLLGGRGPARGQQPAPAAPGPKVVLRISRAFLVKLTRGQFEQDEPIQTSEMGATVVGSAHVAGSYNVVLHASSADSDLELLVNGSITARVVVTRRPVRVFLHGATPLRASRRVTFDGEAFTARPVCVGACVHAGLDEVCTLHNGPAAPLVRCVARAVVLRNLPDAEQSADEEVRSQVGAAVTRETDRILEVLNDVLALGAEAVDLLREEGLPVGRHPAAIAATDDSLLVGVGFAPGEPPQLPAAAGPPQAPVEVWVYHRLSAKQEALLLLLRPKLERLWAERVKGKVRAQLARHSPELARALDGATHEVQLRPVPRAPDWHVIRFSEQLHTVNPPAP